MAERSEAMRCELSGPVAAADRENLDGHPGAHTPGVDELAVIGVVAEQQRPENDAAILDERIVSSLLRRPCRPS